MKDNSTTTNQTTMRTLIVGFGYIAATLIVLLSGWLYIDGQIERSLGGVLISVLVLCATLLVATAPSAS